MPRLEERLSMQRKSRKRRTFTILLILLAFLAVTAASYFLFSSALDKNTTPRKGAALITAQDKVNILVMGVDQRDGDVGRSDTMFVVTVDTKTKSVSMLSIPRDTRVRIPGNGWDKINHAYAEGGHKLTQQAVEGLMGIPIDYYVKINFNGFQKIVDAVGGVDIDVEKRMYYEDPYDGDGLVINLKPGVQHMDGETAIQYVRYRDAEGDIGRIQRQQKFIKAMFNEVASPSVITKIPALIREVGATIETDLSTSEMVNFAQILNDAYKKGLKTDMVPGKPAYINEVSYWLPDLMALRNHMANTLDVKMDDKYVTASRREASEYETSIPKEMKVVEVPKAVQQPKVSTEPVKSQQTDKSEMTKAQKSSSSTTSKVRVEVINASGAADAGNKAAATLRSRGFEVVGVSTLTTPYPSTVVISNSTSSNVLNKFSDLPFKYKLQITKDEEASIQATVVIGKDYLK
ncbi:Transcriptional regulator LytR [bioreactor metagenome]|uniref:Transcriptional regulator LytR n=1 Tax=bioreactor metagenome TaxID=1076179 RepID=A0A644TS16_9ZZZZ|nr:LCP family protein [Negativicutes bacterium]